MTQREIADMLGWLARRMSHQYPAKKLREDAGLTIREVAAELGVCWHTVHRWETGRKFPRSAAGVKWARQVRAWARVNHPGVMRVLMDAPAERDADVLPAPVPAAALRARRRAAP